jgi:hypothetical protein
MGQDAITARWPCPQSVCELCASPENFVAFIRVEAAKYAKVVKDSGVKVD